MGEPNRDIAQAKDFIAPPGYQRHRPETTLLYQLVAEHYALFRDRRAAEGRPLPRYVEDEFDGARRMADTAALLRTLVPTHIAALFS